MSAPLPVPTPDDRLYELVAERAGAATVNLLELTERVRKRLVALTLTPDRIPAVLDVLVAELIAAMGAAARKATTAGADRERVAENATWRTSRLRQFARVLGLSDRPSLTQSLLVLRQAEALASDLTGMVSDGLVTKHTDELRAEARRRAGMVAMWVPERDACARCLRMAGLRLLRPGDRFPAGLSYDPAQQDTGAGTVPGPPLHPRCRCEIQLIPKGQSEEASAALAREADRAILKGWALASEGQASRRRAAAALLTDELTMPVSVVREARKRLREGAPFTRGVPTGNEAPPEKRYLRSYSGVYR